MILNIIFSGLIILEESMEYISNQQRKTNSSQHATVGLENIGISIGVQVWSVYMHSNVKGFKIITLHSNFQFFFLHHFTPKKTWYWLFCIEYQNNMMSHYIEKLYALKWCAKIISIP